jgi:hypothetical protein
MIFLKSIFFMLLLEEELNITYANNLYGVHTNK